MVFIPLMLMLMLVLMLMLMLVLVLVIEHFLPMTPTFLDPRLSRMAAFLGSIGIEMVKGWPVKYMARLPVVRSMILGLAT